MKRKITFLIAALMLLTFTTKPVNLKGQEKTTTDVTINFGTTSGYWAAHTTTSYTDSDSRSWSRTYSAGNKSSGQAGYSQFGNSDNTCTSLVFTATAGSDMTVTAFSVTMSGASSNTAGTIYLYKRSGSTDTQLAIASVSGTSNVTCSISSSQTFSSTDILKVSYVGTAKAIRISQLSYSYTTGGTPTCDTPTFDPVAGTYTSTQSVTISTETTGADIYYTTNGSTPTTSSSRYTSEISVSSTQTIKAIAVKEGNNNSPVATANYYILGHAGTELDPYTVADARTAIDGNNTTYMNSKYATGKVTGIVTAYTAENGVTFDMIDEGMPDKVLRAYRCKGDDAEKVLVGDVVVVSGDLYLYSSKSETATVYEFKENCHLVSYVHYPTINVNKNSLTGFTYTLDNGPSTAQNFTVSGTTLSDDITLSLGLSSSFEMSLSEGSSYTNSLTLTPTTGTVAATTIYVRLKAGLDVNVSYNGTITLTSTGATDRTISLTGSVTEPSFSWNLGTNSYDASPTESLISWTDTHATMKNERNGNSNTAVNNYIPTTQSSTRFYTGNKLTITPAAGYAITSVIFTATTNGYASALGNSTWTNATTSVSEKVTTVTPTISNSAFYAIIGATCGFTSVKVYYYNVPVDGETHEITADVTIPSSSTYSAVTIVIPDGKTLTVNGILNVTSTLTNNGNLIIEDGGQLILAKTNTGVAATVKKDVSAATAASKTDATYWYAISAGVENPSITSNTNIITGGGTPTYDLYRFNEAKNAGNAWENYRNSDYSATFTTLEKGRGYLYRNASDLTITMTGDINVEDFTYNVTKTGSGEYAGFNLIGNPYTHNIYKGAGTAITDGTSTLSTGFYYLEPSTGKWAKGTDNSTAIAPNQGILVQVNETGNINMANTDDDGVAKSNNDYIMLSVANSQYSDEAYAWFDKGIGLNKIEHRNSEIPMLYINQNDENFAIATMSDETQSFNLNFKAATMGKYTLSYKAKGEYNYLHVIDRLTGEDVDMLLDGEYSFIGAPTDNDNRFIVKLSYNANSNATDNDIFAYQSGSDIIVNGEGELQIFDVTGRKVATQHVNGVETINVQLQGVYIFKLNEKVQKIVVR